MGVTCGPVRSEVEFAAVEALLREYFAWLLRVGWNRQGADGYAAELARMRAEYAPPAGNLFLARGNRGEALGCAGMRPAAMPGACEMKRLFVREAARGTGTGRALAEAVMQFAEAAGYKTLLLDTLPTMVSARSLYGSLGFEPVAPYYGDPLPGVLFFGKNLRIST